MNEENFKKWRERRIGTRDKDKKKQKAEQTEKLAGRKTGRQVFEDSSAKVEDEEGDDDTDIMQFLKDKKAEEERLDKENAELVEQMQKEMAELDKEGEKRVEEEVALLQKQQKEAKERAQNGESGTVTTTTTSTTEPPLQGVDTALFSDDTELPEFDDEEEVKDS